jgi:L-threonylcarbamoyladenylate synthase
MTQVPYAATLVHHFCHSSHGIAAGRASKLVEHAVTTRLTHDVAEAAEALSAGKLVAFPTETVYGLGADASNPDALRRLYVAKGRPASHPVIVHLGQSSQFDHWAADVPPEAERLVKAFWPGPLTIILRRAPHVLDEVTGGQETVGLRMPNHPVALDLLRSFGGGVAAPSANRFGRLSPTRAEHVRAELEGRVDLILAGGDAAVGLESTIVDLSGDEPVILRPGHIRPDEVSRVLGRQVSVQAVGGRVRAAGTLPGHYAPATRVRLLDRNALLDIARDADVPVAVLARFPAPERISPHVHWLEGATDPTDFARTLYSDLRYLDHLGAREILVEIVPEDDPAWLAVADRLRRAAYRGDE